MKEPCLERFVLTDSDDALIVDILHSVRNASPSPGKRVSACIFHPKTKAIALGYNCFAKGIPNDPSIWYREDSPLYSNVLVRQHVVVHAEVNALKMANSMNMSLDECELYCTLLPCVDCFRDVVLNSGIKKVYYLDCVSSFHTSEVLDALCHLSDTAGITLCKLTTAERL